MNREELLAKATSLRDALIARGMEVRTFEVGPCASIDEVESLEATIGAALPPDLRRFLLEITGDFSIEWWVPDHADIDLAWFGGGVSWSVAGIRSRDKAQLEWIRDVFNLPDDPAAAIWREKLAFHAVGNGDLLSVDLNEPTLGSVVYLGHDGDEDNGAIVGTSFETFIERWLQIGFLGPDIAALRLFLDGPGNDLNPDGPAAQAFRTALGIAIDPTTGLVADHPGAASPTRLPSIGERWLASLGSPNVQDDGTEPRVSLRFIAATEPRRLIATMLQHTRYPPSDTEEVRFFHWTDTFEITVRPALDQDGAHACSIDIDNIELGDRIEGGHAESRGEVKNWYPHLLGTGFTVLIAPSGAGFPLPPPEQTPTNRDRTLLERLTPLFVTNFPEHPVGAGATWSQGGTPISISTHLDEIDASSYALTGTATTTVPQTEHERLVNWTITGTNTAGGWQSADIAIVERTQLSVGRVHEIRSTLTIRTRQEA